MIPSPESSQAILSKRLKASRIFFTPTRVSPTSGVRRKFPRERLKFRHNREASQTSFNFAKTAWFCFTFFHF